MKPSLASKRLLEPCQIDSRPIVTPSVLLVPMLAFDPIKLTRLGYGGGYYDRTIEMLKMNSSKNQVKTIGIALECLKCDNLPTEQVSGADQPLDLIVTEMCTYARQ